MSKVDEPGYVPPVEDLGGLKNFDEDPSFVPTVPPLDGQINHDDPLAGIGGLEDGQLQDLDKFIDEKNSGNPAPNPNDPPTPTKTTTSTGDGSFISETFNHMKEVFGEEFQVPQDVTQETFLEKVYESLYPSFQKSLNPQAAALNEFLRSGGNVDDWMKSQQQLVDYNKMPTDDLLYNYYKEQIGLSDENPEGLTDDEIRSYVNKKDVADRKIEAMGIRNSLNKAQEAANRELAASQSVITAQKEKEYSDGLLASAKQTVAKVGKLSDIYGVPVNETEIANFNAEFEKLIIPDNTGLSPAQRILYDDVNLYKLLFIASKAGQTKNLVTDAQNRQIKEIKDKLSPNPTAFQSNQAWNSNTGPDLDKLAMPAR